MTNLPASVPAATVADLYRKGWRIEGLFQDPTAIPKCAANTPGYPKAAPFGFCAAVAAGHVFATLRAGSRAARGTEKVGAGGPTYYLAGPDRGMAVALPPEKWTPVGRCDVPTFGRWLVDLARTANLKRSRKRPRGPKEPRRRRTRFTREKHISTAKLLAAEKANERHP